MAPFNLPALTRTLLVALLGFTALNTLLRPSNRPLEFFYRTGQGSPLLSLVPGTSFKYPWTLVTATFVEQNIFGMIVSGLTIFFGGRYLERAWGAKDFAKFILITCIIPNTLCFLIYIFFYEASKSNRALTATVSGSIAIQSAFLVAFKQLVPEHTVSLLNVIKMRVKHFPAVFLLANTISGLVIGTETAMFLSWISFLTSWTFLRFYRVSPLVTSSTGESSTIRGDASDTFAFAYFFPEPLHTPLATLCDQIYNVLVSIKVCTPFSESEIDVGNEQALARSEGTILPTVSRGSRREEAERRRALALKALNQRLDASSTNAPGEPSGTS